MEIQILDVDYVLVDEKPIIRIFGKTPEGTTVCGFYEGFAPYFYSDNERVKEVLEGEPGVVGIQKSSMKFVDKECGAYKIITRNPAKTPEIRSKAISAGVTPYEADILFRYRFMNDFGLGGLCWIQADATPIGTSTVKVERTFKLSNVKRLDKIIDAPMKMVAFDIECVSETEVMPEAKKDPVILISMAFNTEHQGQKDLVLSTRPGKDLKAFESEKEMLQEFINIINSYDPDIITGYNTTNFDFPYILERMRKLGVKAMFGRCNTKPAVDRKVGADYRITITGRVSADSFKIIKKDYSLVRYGLDFVGEKLMGEKKVDIKKSQIGKYWKGPQEEFEKLVYYSKIDSVLALNLVLKLKLLTKYFSLSKVAGTLLQDTLDGGEATRIENFLLREFNKDGYIFPNKPSDSETVSRQAKAKIELKGGFVLDPKKGLHSDVVVFDFKSMYPSIMISFNICPTTLVRNREGVDKNNVFESPAGAWFLKPEIKKGIVPKIVDELMTRRTAAKKKQKEATDEFLKASLYGEQWALKILANAFYGYLGYARARMYNLDIANSITSFGRDIIHQTKTMMEEKGFDVVYGDTDSLMVKIGVDDLEKIRPLAFSVSKEISEKLPGVMELQFEKVFKRFLPLSKKRYVAWKFEPTKDGWDEKLEMKGVETVRRDWCPLVSQTMRSVIEVILKENDIKKAVVYFKGVIGDIVNGKIDINTLVVTKTITKKPENYDGVQPHVELAKKILARGGEVGVGDRIGYVIIKGMDI
ncbi:MAG TPA: DNA-directed DNA polymerase, partial [archaeon]|nr:DNA-directed DNA polymerase [archaeon]